MLTLGLGGIYFFLVLDHAADTVFGRRGLRIGDTSNHTRVNVRPIERTTEQRTGVVARLGRTKALILIRSSPLPTWRLHLRQCARPVGAMEIV